jgi:hypothetical protein
LAGLAVSLQSDIDPDQAVVRQIDQVGCWFPGQRPENATVNDFEAA